MENAPPASPPIVTLRHMRSDDVVAVLKIERLSFAQGWPATAFERELSQNKMARYIVLEGDGYAGVDGLLGFAGLWLMVEEAHVVTVAVAPAERGRGFGRLLVHGLLGLARDSGMLEATLECRVSNAAARALYGSYGFYEVGLRKRYYSNNQEDAVIMTTEPLASPAYVARYARLEQQLHLLLPGVATCIAD
jgi:[ribosomal protein S18]-alanine N-acetyltransferase